MSTQKVLGDFIKPQPSARVLCLLCFSVVRLYPDVLALGQQYKINRRLYFLNILKEELFHKKTN